MTDAASLKDLNHWIESQKIIFLEKIGFFGAFADELHDGADWISVDAGVEGPMAALFSSPEVFLEYILMFKGTDRDCSVYFGAEYSAVADDLRQDLLIDEGK